MRDDRLESAADAHTRPQAPSSALLTKQLREFHAGIVNYRLLRIDELHRPFIAGRSCSKPLAIEPSSRRTAAEEQAKPAQGWAGFRSANWHANAVNQAE